MATKVMIILSIGLVAASVFSYYTIEAFGQLPYESIDCPNTAYYGYDNSGNTVCRDLTSNQIVQPLAIESNEPVVEEPVIEQAVEVEPVKPVIVPEIQNSEESSSGFWYVIYGLIVAAGVVGFGATAKGHFQF